MASRFSDSILIAKFSGLVAVVCVTMVVVCCLLIHLLQYFGFGVGGGGLILGPFSISKITSSSSMSTSAVTVFFVTVPVADTVLEPVRRSN
jgi:hypothetical protein